MQRQTCSQPATALGLNRTDKTGDKPMPTHSHTIKIFFFGLSILMMVWCEPSLAGGYRYSGDNTVVGSLRNHTVQPKETLLDIARKFGLGFNEVEILYSDMDYWVPAPGRRLVMPTQWILPSTRFYGLLSTCRNLDCIIFSQNTGW